LSDSAIVALLRRTMFLLTESEVKGNDTKEEGSQAKGHRERKRMKLKSDILGHIKGLNRGLVSFRKFITRYCSGVLNGSIAGKEMQEMGTFAIRESVRLRAHCVRGMKQVRRKPYWLLGVIMGLICCFRSSRGPGQGFSASVANVIERVRVKDWEAMMDEEKMEGVYAVMNAGVRKSLYVGESIDMRRRFFEEIHAGKKAGGGCGTRYARIMSRQGVNNFFMVPVVVMKTSSWGERRRAEKKMIETLEANLNTKALRGPALWNRYLKRGRRCVRRDVMRMRRALRECGDHGNKNCEICERERSMRRRGVIRTFEVRLGERSTRAIISS
jgi:hypothetical protein